MPVTDVSEQEMKSLIVAALTGGLDTFGASRLRLVTIDAIEGWPTGEVH